MPAFRWGRTEARHTVVADVVDVRMTLPSATADAVQSGPLLAGRFRIHQDESNTTPMSITNPLGYMDLAPSRTLAPRRSPVATAFTELGVTATMLEG